MFSKVPRLGLGSSPSPVKIVREPLHLSARDCPWSRVLSSRERGRNSPSLLYSLLLSLVHACLLTRLQPQLSPRLSTSVIPVFTPRLGCALHPPLVLHRIADLLLSTLLLRTSSPIKPQRLHNATEDALPADMDHSSWPPMPSHLVHQSLPVLSAFATILAHHHLGPGPDGPPHDGPPGIRLALRLGLLKDRRERKLQSADTRHHQPMDHLILLRLWPLRLSSLSIFALRFAHATSSPA
jgi:hypothetical protein